MPACSPVIPGAKIVSRVLVSPLSAKLLVRALTENLAKYEAQFGEIKIPERQSLADFLFKPPNKDNEPRGRGIMQHLDEIADRLRINSGCAE